MKTHENERSLKLRNTVKMWLTSFGRLSIWSSYYYIASDMWEISWASEEHGTLMKKRALTLKSSPREYLLVSSFTLAFNWWHFYLEQQPINGKRKLWNSLKSTEFTLNSIYSIRVLIISFVLFFKSNSIITENYLTQSWMWLVHLCGYQSVPPHCITGRAIWLIMTNLLSFMSVQ